MELKNSMSRSKAPDAKAIENPIRLVATGGLMSFPIDMNGAPESNQVAQRGSDDMFLIWIKTTPPTRPRRRSVLNQTRSPMHVRPEIPDFVDGIG